MAFIYLGKYNDYRAEYGLQQDMYTQQSLSSQVDEQDLEE